MTDPQPLPDAFALRLLAETYALAVDTGDGDLFAACFTPAGELVSPKITLSGHEKLRAVPAMVAGAYRRTHHSVTGLVPQIAGDSATARTYCLARHYYADAAGRPMCFEMTICYDDRFTRSPAGWKIARRVLEVLGETRIPLAS